MRYKAPSSGAFLDLFKRVLYIYQKYFINTSYVDTLHTYVRYRLRNVLITHRAACIYTIRRIRQEALSICRVSPKAHPAGEFVAYSVHSSLSFRSVVVVGVNNLQK